MLALALFLAGCQPPGVDEADRGPSMPADWNPVMAGARTKGGEGGPTVTVTSLKDSGPGSLRAVLSESGPKVVAFAVGGDIPLERALIVRHPHVTLAGETAPSPGITLRGATLRIKASDVIVRHLRVRVGAGPGDSPEDRDGIAVLGSPEGDRVVENVLIDHCSVSWAIDEGISTWHAGVRAITIRDSIVAETLDRSIHPKGGHSMGLLVGRHSKGVLIYRNLLAHNQFRNPGISAGATAAVVNNLIYDPGYRALHFYGAPDSPEPTLVTAVDNLVIAGPATRETMGFFGNGLAPGSRIHLAGNQSQGTVAMRPDDDDLAQAGFNPFVEWAPVSWYPGLPVLAAANLEAAIVEDVGARPWDRDATDRRILGELKARGGHMRDAVPAGEDGR
jgi:hypothetical protein